MSRWTDAGAWVGDDLRREVFFFPSGAVDLYGSLYASAELTRPYGLVACASWGVEADRTDPLQRSVALAMARLGGAGLVFHYPGYGDSFGELASIGFDDLVRAAQDAVAEASRRAPDLTWMLAGFMFGASVASLARLRTGGPLLFVQPALRPTAYFQGLARSTRPLAPGPSPREMMEVGAAPGVVYGYPIPGRIVDAGADADAAVGRALASPGGDGAVVHHRESGAPDLAPGGFEWIEVPGRWRFGSLDQPELAEAAVRWLDRRTGVRLGERASR